MKNYLLIFATMISCNIFAMDSNHGLVNLSKIDPTICVDIFLAKSNHFFTIPIYSKSAAYLLKPVAEALKRAQDIFRAQELELVVGDAYRPRHIQQLLWDKHPDERYVAHPDRSRHTRGAAVDVTLRKINGDYLEMPTNPIKEQASERSHSDFMDLPENILKNRKILQDGMTAAGFSIYKFEWWHFEIEECMEYPILNIPFDDLED